MALDAVDQLQKLVGLARRHARQSRRVLEENVTDLFLSDEGRLSDREAALMNDVLRKLIHDIERAVRTELVRRLTDAESAPAELAEALASENAEIARPILMKGSVLRDPELIELVKHRTHEYLMSLARRERTGPDVTEVLVEKAAGDAIEELLKGGDAALARRTNDYVVDQARRLDRFQQPVLRPAELPDPVLRRVFWWVSAALREHLVTTAGLVEAVAEDFLKDATRTALDAALAAAAAENAAETLAARLDQSCELVGAFLVNILRQGHVALFLAILARRCAIGRQTARRILFDAGGESLAIACKALSLDRKEFAAVILLTRRPGDPTPATEVLSRIAELFDSLTQRNAFLALRYWQEDDDYLQAVEEIRQEAG